MGEESGDAWGWAVDPEAQSAVPGLHAGADGGRRSQWGVPTARGGTGVAVALRVRV